MRKEHETVLVSQPDSLALAVDEHSLAGQRGDVEASRWHIRSLQHSSRHHCSEREEREAQVAWLCVCK
jgi:hypothetical protein